MSFAWERGGREEDKREEFLWSILKQGKIWIPWSPFSFALATGRNGYLATLHPAVEWSLPVALGTPFGVLVTFLVWSSQFLWFQRCSRSITQAGRIPNAGSRVGHQMASVDKKLLILGGLGPFRNEMWKGSSCRNCHTVVTWLNNENRRAFVVGAL